MTALDVLILTPNAPPLTGGICRLSFDLIRALRLAGSKVSCVAASSERMSEAGLVVVPVLGRGRIGKVVGSLEFATRSALQAVRGRPDVVVAVTWRVAAAIAVLPRRLRPSLVIMALGSELLRGGRLASLIRRATFSRADRIVSISQGTSRVLCRSLGIDDDKVTMIHPGVWPLTSSASAHRAKRARPFSVLSVGRLDRRKGHGDLIEAVGLLRDRGVACTLRIVGEGTDREFVERCIRDRRLEASVKLLGRQSDVQLTHEFNSADAFALLTRDSPRAFEGFGIVFVEAAQHGLPILAGESGGSSEAVKAGFNGALVKSAVEAAAVLEQWISDPQERQRLAESSLCWAQGFEWDSIIPEYLRILSDLPAARSRSIRSAS